MKRSAALPVDLTELFSFCFPRYVLNMVEGADMAIFVMHPK